MKTAPFPIPLPKETLSVRQAKFAKFEKLREMYVNYLSVNQ